MIRNSKGPKLVKRNYNKNEKISIKKEVDTIVVTGDTGPVGDLGPVGDTGPTGNFGFMGTTGVTGPTGAPGLKGDTGSMGSTGFSGMGLIIPGPIGPTGVIGSTGEVGPIASIVIWTSAVPPPNYLICDGSAISRITYSTLFNLFFNNVPSLPYGVGDGSTTFNLPDLRQRTGMGTNIITFVSTITASTTMVVTSVTNGILSVGQVLSGGGVTVGTTILSQIGGTPGGIGSYTVSILQTSAPTTVLIPAGALGTTNGSLTTTLAIPNLPAHSHGITDPGHNHAITDPFHSHAIPGPAVSAGSFITYATTANSIILSLSTNNSSTGITVNTGFTGITTQNTVGAVSAIFNNYPPILTINYIIRYI